MPGALDGEPHRHPRGFHFAAALIWCALIATPVLEALSGGGTPAHFTLRLIGAIAFVATAVVLAASQSDRRCRLRLAPAQTTAVFALLLALATAMNVNGDGSWVYLYFYCAGFASLLPERSLIYPAAALAILGAGLSSWLCGGAGGNGDVVSTMVSAAGVALVLILVRDLGDRNDALRDARSELARLAVAAERERFARDLHDLLGHSLTLIAIKAELAGRLVASDPKRAASEIGDVEAAARDSLLEVREAVGGYRQPDLATELADAERSLAVAGFAADVEVETGALRSDSAAVLAWAVREGTTNVVRHSAGGRCRIVLRGGGERGAAVMVITDDGSTMANLELNEGNGLRGLRERVEAGGGELTVGPADSGGFALTVKLPGAEVVDGDMRKRKPDVAGRLRSMANGSEALRS